MASVCAIENWVMLDTIIFGRVGLSWVSNDIRVNDIRESNGIYSKYNGICIKTLEEKKNNDGLMINDVISISALTNKWKVKIACEENSLPCKLVLFKMNQIIMIDLIKVKILFNPMNLLVAS